MTDRYRQTRTRSRALVRARAQVVWQSTHVGFPLFGRTNTFYNNGQEGKNSLALSFLHAPAIIFLLYLVNSLIIVPRSEEGTNGKEAPPLLLLQAGQNSAHFVVRQ